MLKLSIPGPLFPAVAEERMLNEAGRCAAAFCGLSNGVETKAPEMSGIR